MKLQKHMSMTNVCSRRQAELAISQGLVFVNGQPAHIGQDVDHTIDRITYDPCLTSKVYRYYAYHKPEGIETTNPQPGNKAICDVIEVPPGVLLLGRLDKDTSGLILLTDDRTIQKSLFAVSSASDLLQRKKMADGLVRQRPIARDLVVGIEKEYVVTVHTSTTDEQLTQLEQGVMIPDVLERRVDTANKRARGANHVATETRHYLTKPAVVRKLDHNHFTLTITEGKNRQVRKMCRAVGLTVTALKRVRIGSIRLAALPVGEGRVLTDEEVRSLKDM